MSDEATMDASGFSLSNTFNKFNHIRHFLMDLSMLGMVVRGAGAIIATGGVVGFLDPVLALAKMYVSGIPGLIGLPDFFAAAADNPWFTGVDMDMAMNHGGDMAGDMAAQTMDHAAHGVADITSRADWLSTLPADELQQIIEDAAGAGMSVEEYTEYMAVGPKHEFLPWDRAPQN